jgi:hypothetical protein
MFDIEPENPDTLIFYLADRRFISGELQRIFDSSGFSYAKWDSNTEAVVEIADM